MKVVWEAKDIKGGRLTKKPGTGRDGDWMIGWDARAPARWCLIALADGMVAHPGSTAEALAEKLTQSGHVPMEIYSAYP